MSGAAVPPGAQVTYSQQYRRCGKASCLRCAAGGRGHGPYWYAYWWEGRRQHSRYLGKHAPEEIAGRGAAAISADVLAVAPLRVRTLGGFAVWRGATPLPPEAWTSRRATALFLCLVTAPGHRLHREQASDLLWPEANPTAGAANLRTTIRLLRQILGVPGATMTYLRTEGAVLVLAPAGGGEPAADWLDATAFARAAERALAGPDGAACRAALALYGGDYLPDEPYAAWAEQLRASLRRQYVDLLLHLATLSGAHGAVEEAADCLRRVLVVEPSHEAAAATLMGLLAAAGRRSEALQVYQRLATVLEEDLDLAPSAEVAGLRARLVAQEAAPVAARVPARAEQPARLTNLPLALTSFVGRRWDMPAVAETVRTGRLVTLTGPGGCGKTRLALEVAARLVEAYADGVWLVELAALADPALVPRALAGVLGLVEGAGQSMRDALVGFLRPRHALVVLDNCEHLIGACAELATVLLQSCPHLRLLTTSREHLEVAGEQIYLVPSLAVPDPTHLPSLERLATYEAVQLFMERARARRPDLTVTAANAGAITQVCARLDGLPLAIELAAARVGVLPVEGIAARLDDRFRLLTAGPRTALPRQQTLRATLEWSYELLTDPERVVLRRLAVFAGGCTLAAAEAVCADPSGSHPHGARGLGDGAVLDLLSGLVHKSLVQLEEGGPRGGTAAPRYRLLETVRQYALERLAESGEEAALRQQHAAHFRAFAQRAAEDLAGQTAWPAQMVREHDNLRAALRWLLDTGHGEQALQLALHLLMLWNIGLHYAEGQSWLEEGLAQSMGAPVALRARGTNCAAMLAVQRGEFAQAEVLGEAAVQWFREAGDRDGLAGSLIIHGYAATQQGNYGDGQRLLEESLALSEELHGPRGRAHPLHHLSEIALGQGQYDWAVALSSESVALSRTYGGGWLMGHRLENLARGLLGRGDVEEAIPRWMEGLRIAVEHDDTRHVIYHTEGLATAAAQQGQPVRAARLVGAAHALREQISCPLSGPEAAHLERFLAPARTQLDAAAWDAAWHEGAALPLDEAIAYALQGEAERTRTPRRGAGAHVEHLAWAVAGP